VATWIATYDVAILVINIKDFKFSENYKYNSPRTRYARGRPKKKKQNKKIYRVLRGLRNDELELKKIDRLVIRPKIYCGICGEIGHNAQIYRQAYK
jgi:hypothetical protein